MEKTQKKVVRIKRQKTQVVDKEAERESIRTALLKKALGYNEEEINEEWVKNEEGEFCLNKKKVSIKHYPSDNTAAKVYLEEYCKSSNGNIEDLSEEQLEQEKQRLLQLLDKNR